MLSILCAIEYKKSSVMGSSVFGFNAVRSSLLAFGYGSPSSKADRTPTKNYTKIRSHFNTISRHLRQFFGIWETSENIVILFLVESSKNEH